MRKILFGSALALVGLARRRSRASDAVSSARRPGAIRDHARTQAVAASAFIADPTAGADKRRRLYGYGLSTAYAYTPMPAPMPITAAVAGGAAECASAADELRGAGFSEGRRFTPPRSAAPSAFRASG